MKVTIKPKFTRLNDNREYQVDGVYLIKMAAAGVKIYTDRRQDPIEIDSDYNMIFITEGK